MYHTCETKDAFSLTASNKKIQKQDQKSKGIQWRSTHLSASAHGSKAAAAAATILPLLPRPYAAAAAVPDHFPGAQRRLTPHRRRKVYGRARRWRFSSDTGVQRGPSPDFLDAAVAGQRRLVQPATVA
ncbi:hypothetical protein BRADI_2g01112v3 [Brachypodium distachyon]|uniref:Uncharacterized protein n=1 Tax=Brachypodium distachyon TaxID=15368 RepID=A0A0Q3FT98_BRADI|nr:hypothetical protein BRADI_2g01112v3 [Brachypodium distachyon]